MLEAVLLLLTSVPFTVSAGNGTVYLIRGTPAAPVVLQCKPILAARLSPDDTSPRVLLLYGRSEDGSDVEYNANRMLGHVFSRKDLAYLEAARRARAEGEKALKLADELTAEAGRGK